MRQESVKKHDLKHYLDIAYELLYKANQYQESDLQKMQAELVEFKHSRASVPSAIDAAIAAKVLGIQLDGLAQTTLK